MLVPGLRLRSRERHERRRMRLRRLSPAGGRRLRVRPDRRRAGFRSRNSGRLSGIRRRRRRGIPLCLGGQDGGALRRFLRRQRRHGGRRHGVISGGRNAPEPSASRPRRLALRGLVRQPEPRPRLPRHRAVDRPRDRVESLRPLGSSRRRPVATRLPVLFQKLQGALFHDGPRRARDAHVHEPELEIRGRRLLRGDGATTGNRPALPVLFQGLPRALLHDRRRGDADHSGHEPELEIRRNRLLRVSVGRRRSRCGRDADLPVLEQVLPAPFLYDFGNRDADDPEHEPELEIRRNCLLDAAGASRTREIHRSFRRQRRIRGDVADLGGEGPLLDAARVRLRPRRLRFRGMGDERRRPGLLAGGRNRRPQPLLRRRRDGGPLRDVGGGFLHREVRPQRRLRHDGGRNVRPRPRTGASSLLLLADRPRVRRLGDRPRRPRDLRRRPDRRRSRRSFGRSRHALRQVVPRKLHGDVRRQRRHRRDVRPGLHLRHPAESRRQRLLPPGLDLRGLGGIARRRRRLRRPPVRLGPRRRWGNQDALRRLDGEHLHGPFRRQRRLRHDGGADLRARPDRNPSR